MKSFEFEQRSDQLQLPTTTRFPSSPLLLSSGSKGHDNAPAPSSVASTVDQKAHKPSGGVGERSPHRDEVGKTQTKVESTNCAFSGPIELDALRLVQSMIQEVQCPALDEAGNRLGTLQKGLVLPKH